MFLFLCFMSCLILSVTAKNEMYMGYKVYNVKLENEEQQLRLSEIDNDIVDYWRRPSHKHEIVGRAMVPPSHFDWFEEKLEDFGIARDIYIENVYEYLKKTDTSSLRDNIQREFDFEGYYGYEQILAYMTALEAAYANSTTINIELIQSDETDEGRALVYLKITQADNTEKPVVIIESGINPREWITVPVTLSIVNKLLEDGEVGLSFYDWIIIPVVNPDGYEYTHTNLRLWSKSRSIRSNLGFICPGVNINRNFDIDWLVSGSSSSPCSHLYAGTEPFSEPESRFIRNIIEEYGSRARLYFSLQNTGGFISYPWQFERSATGMFRQHHLLGLDMVAAMNDTYRVDVSSLVGDRASGTGSDYAMKGGILYTYNIDIVQRGDNGVDVPVTEIGNIVEDVWMAVVTACSSIL